MEKLLHEFGLTRNEAKIYLQLLELGTAKAGALTAKTGIHRRNVYDSIERLLKKGLVGYITQNNRKYFTAKHPRHFHTLLEKEHEALKQKEQDLKNLLPKLILPLASKMAQRVTIYEGREGCITILEDVLKTSKTNCVFSTSELAPILDYLQQFHRKRVRLKILDKILVDKNDRRRGQKLAKLPYTEIRVQRRAFGFPLAINVYGNKVGLLILSNNSLGILIEDKDVANSFRKYFKLLWETAEEP